MTTKNRILILCTGNSARSQLAEAIINAQRGDQWEAVSAGTKPAPQVHPAALQVLAEIGMPFVQCAMAFHNGCSRCWMVTCHRLPPEYVHCEEVRPEICYP